MKATVFIAASVDGFIAREDGAIDWLPAGGGDSGDDYGYGELMASVDALVMGRNTYDLVRSFGQWPYGDKPVVVLTHRDLVIPDDLVGSVSVAGGSPRQVVEQLTARGYSHLYVDGGRTIQTFMREGLIQELIITRIPILIGTGIPLFGALLHDVRLRHVETKSYANGLTQSRYKVIGDDG